MVNYAPPALSARLLHVRATKNQSDEDDEQPWWKFSPEEEVIDKDVKALVTHKGHAEEIASLTTPKVSPSNPSIGSLLTLFFNLSFNRVYF